MGIVVLPAVVSFSKTLARLSIGLDRRPELIAHLTRRTSTGGGDEAGERVTLVESSANVIREAFKKCLSERSGDKTGLDSNGRPEGRRIGIYLCANICLKLFFHCRKLRSAEQIFGNIYQQSPPLSRFPASQRVTFLYYLGRYLFANNHFYRAQLTLQAAYEQCHKGGYKQRRSILIYLIASNLILGRFPSASLLSRPEAAGLTERFLPLCHAIRSGDMATFGHILDINSPSSTWFLHYRILFQLKDRCEVLLWRSLARKTFLLSGFKGNDGTKRAPSFDLTDVLTLVRLFERRIRATQSNGFRLIDAPSLAMGEIDPDLEGEVQPEDDLSSMETIEAGVASLTNQGLLHGYISHKYERFVITGAKTKGPLEVGFPKPWSVIQSKADEEVPGWVKDQAAVQRAATGGMVVNLSGARPVGAAPA
jgi:hypothetical protein